MVQYSIDPARADIVQDSFQLESAHNYVTYFDFSFDMLRGHLIFGVPVVNALLLCSENMQKQKLKYVKQHTDQVKSVQVGKFSRLVLSGSSSSHIFISNIHTFKQISRISNVFKNNINALRFFDKDKKFLAGCWGGTIGIFDLHPRLKKVKKTTFKENIFTLAISQNLKHYVVAGWSNDVRVFENE